jgi:hypothetical protein
MKFLKWFVMSVAIVFAGTGDYILHSTWSNGRPVAPFVYAKTDSALVPLIDTIVHDSLPRYAHNIGIAGTDNTGKVVPSVVLHGDSVSNALVQASNFGAGFYTNVFGYSSFGTGWYSSTFGRHDTALSRDGFLTGVLNKDSSVYGTNFLSGLQNKTLNSYVTSISGVGNIDSGSQFTRISGDTNKSKANAYSSMEGYRNTMDSAYACHVSGLYNLLTNFRGSSVEGYQNKLLGVKQFGVPEEAHVEGTGNLLDTNCSYVHVEGQYDTCHTHHAHIGGYANVAKGSYSFTEGTGNVGHIGQTIFGRFSEDPAMTDTNFVLGQKVFKVGWGSDAAHRKNIFTVSDSGFIAQSGVKSATSLATDTGGRIVAGSIGNNQQSNLDSGTAVSLVSATPKTITQITLPAGNWLISGEVIAIGYGAPYLVKLECSRPLVTNTLPTNGHQSATMVNSNLTSSDRQACVLPTYFYSTAGATFYLTANAVWTGGTGVSAYGFISATRVN